MKRVRIWTKTLEGAKSLKQKYQDLLEGYEVTLVWGDPDNPPDPDSYDLLFVSGNLRREPGFVANLMVDNSKIYPTVDMGAVLMKDQKLKPRPRPRVVIWAAQLATALELSKRYHQVLKETQSIDRVIGGPPPHPDSYDLLFVSCGMDRRTALENGAREGAVHRYPDIAKAIMAWCENPPTQHTQTTQEEDTMNNTLDEAKQANPTPYEERVYVYGVNANVLSDDELIERIQRLEAEAEQLRSIKSESTAVKTRAVELMDGAKKIAKLLDERHATK